MHPFTRTCQIDHRDAGEDGLIDIAISSESPYERWFGVEILSHSPDSVDLSRLADGRHPLLLGHDTEKQIGVVRACKIDDDKVLRGSVKFSRSALGQEILNDVQDGIRGLVSVGYFVDEIEEVEEDENGAFTVKRTLSGDAFRREMEQKHGESYFRCGQAADRAKGDKPPVFVVTRWTPFEASIVPVPADASVGVGRSAGVESDPQAPHQTTATQIRILEKTMQELTQKTPAELDVERIKSILALGSGEPYAKYLKPGDMQKAIDDGKSVDWFRELIMSRMETRHTDTRDMHIGMTEKEVRRYSFGKALLAAMTGNWSDAGFERECSQAVAQKFGRAAEGFYLPLDAFRRDFNVGTTSEAGNLVATDLRTDLYVDALRNNLVMVDLGARVLTGLSSSVDLPRKSSVSAIGSLTEIGSASETAPATAKVTLSPKRVGAFVEVSKQAIIQSAMAIENMIRDDLIMSAAVQLEYNFINGNGTAPQPTGIRNTTGIGTATAGANGLAPTWAHMVDLESACANSNAEPDRLAGYLMNTKTRGKLKQTQLGTNLPFIWQPGAQPVNGYRVAVSNNVPSNLTKGTSTTVCSAAIFGADWSMATIGFFGAPDIVVDGISKADTGQVKIVLNQFADFGVRQPACFAKIDDLLA